MCVLIVCACVVCVSMHVVYTRMRACLGMCVRGGGGSILVHTCEYIESNCYVRTARLLLCTVRQDTEYSSVFKNTIIGSIEATSSKWHIYNNNNLCVFRLQLIYHFYVHITCMNAITICCTEDCNNIAFSLASHTPNECSHMDMHMGQQVKCTYCPIPESPILLGHGLTKLNAI